MPSIPVNKFFPLLTVGVPTEIMIKILEETEGDPILKKEFLEIINPTISKEKQNQRLKERPKILSDTTSEILTAPVTDLDG